MYKTAFTILLIAIYSITQTVSGIDLHFCQDNLKSVGISNILPAKSCCEIAQNEGKEPCCSDTTVETNDSEEHTLSSTHFNVLPDQLLCLGVIWNFNYNTGLDYNSKTNFFYENNPPPLSSIPLYKLHQQFIIYS